MWGFLIVYATITMVLIMISSISMQLSLQVDSAFSISWVILSWPYLIWSTCLSCIGTISANRQRVGLSLISSWISQEELAHLSRWYCRELSGRMCRSTQSSWFWVLWWWCMMSCSWFSTIACTGKTDNLKIHTQLSDKQLFDYCWDWVIFVMHAH